MAPVSVFYYSQNLTETIIEIQEIFTNERTDLKVQFDRAQQVMMKNLCGITPNETLKNKYELLKKTEAIK